MKTRSASTDDMNVVHAVARNPRDNAAGKGKELPADEKQGLGEMRRSKQRRFTEKKIKEDSGLEK